MIATLLYISGLAFAAFMGAIVGAGLIQAARRESDAKRDSDIKASSESIANLLEGIVASHNHVDALIAQSVVVLDQVQALSAFNSQILRILEEARHAAGLAALAAAATGRPN